jgi:MipA family protein
MRRIVVAALVAAISLPARAVELPLWEVGAGALGLRLPDYRGSDESRSYVYPFPYVVYRGQALRVDRDGVRAIFFESDRAELDLSLHGSPPTDSENNRTRRGMDDLDPTLEIGPRLNFTVLRDRSGDWRLDLRLPLRAAIATDLSNMKGIGYVFAPHLQLDMRPVFLGGGWNLGVQAGPLYASRSFHRYFYAVDPQFAAPGRPAYSPGGGYSGALVLLSASRRFARFWLGAFMRYDMLDGAVFADSPLVRRDHGVMAGVSLAWVFAQSREKVQMKLGAP